MRQHRTPPVRRLQAAVRRTLRRHDGTALAERALRDAYNRLVDVEAGPAVIDAAFLLRRGRWSQATFGPGRRTAMVVDHLRRELVEIEDAPGDLAEWVDVALLAFDGATRAGWSAQQIIDAVVAKQAVNETRRWPDWRTQPPDRAIAHLPDSAA